MASYLDRKGATWMLRSGCLPDNMIMTTQIWEGPRKIHVLRAVQSHKPWVPQWTIHGGSQGGPCYRWGVRIWCGQKWQWNSNIQLCVIYFQPVSKMREIDILSSPIALKFNRWLGSNSSKLRLSYFKVKEWSILRHNLTASRLQDILR